MGHQSGSNLIEGGDGNDQLYGQAGNDTIYGNDRLYAIDNYTISSSDDSKHLYGGSGVDTLYSGFYGGNHGAGIYVNLETGHSIGRLTGRDRLYSIENVYGDWGNDTLIGSDDDNVLDGFGRSFASPLDYTGGKDLLQGGGGNDLLFGGGAGSDCLTSALVGQI